jgi:O-antigen/teichoic acid export membrane protein
MLLQAAAVARRGGFRVVSWRELRLVARRNRQCPTMLLPGHVALVVATQGPVYAIEAIAGPAAAGSFLMAQRILLQPVQFVSGALAQAFFPEAARRYRAAGECWSLYRKALLLLAACAAPVLVLATPAGPALVDWVLGAKWAEAGAFAQILAIAAAIRLLDAPLSSIRLVAGRYGFDLLWKASLMTFVMAGSAIGARAGGGTGAVIGLAVALTLLHSASLAFAIRLATGSIPAR